MRTIRIDNPVLNTYITDVSADYSSGVSLSVRSNNSFAANDIIVAGNPSEELTEGKKINGISSTNILTLASALNFAHNKTTPIYKTPWDYVSIEGRSSSAGVFAEITQSGIQWDSKSRKTIYSHLSGDDNWEYRFRFYNSVLGSYSEYSPTLTGAGFTQFQMGYIIRDARIIAGDQDERVLTTDECLRVLTRAKNIIRAHNARYWFWKVNGYNSNKSIVGTADNSVYSLSDITDIGIIDTIEYRYNSGNTNQKYILRSRPDAEFDSFTRDLNRPGNDHPRIFRQLPPDANSTAGYIEIENALSTSGVGTFYLNYYKAEPNYNSVDDITSVIIPEILEDYLIGAIYAAKANSAKSKEYKDLFYGPQARKKTLGLENLTGISLLDELDRQYKNPAGQPKSVWRFRGQRAISRLYGNRSSQSPDYIRENYFNGPE